MSEERKPLAVQLEEVGKYRCRVEATKNKRWSRELRGSMELLKAEPKIKLERSIADLEAQIKKTRIAEDDKENPFRVIADIAKAMLDDLSGTFVPKEIERIGIQANMVDKFCMLSGLRWSKTECKDDEAREKFRMSLLHS